MMETDIWTETLKMGFELRFSYLTHITVRISEIRKSCLRSLWVCWPNGFMSLLPQCTKVLFAVSKSNAWNLSILGDLVQCD